MPSVLPSTQGEAVTAMIASALPYVVSIFVGAVLGWAIHRWGTCEHRFDDGTDRYEILPYESNSDKMGISRKTVYCCQVEDCHAEETEQRFIKAVDRDECEQAITDMSPRHPRGGL